MEEKEKCRINHEIMKKLAELEISSKSFQSGAIYMTNDQKVLFPTRREAKNKPRMVVQLTQPRDRKLF